MRPERGTPVTRAPKITPVGATAVRASRRDLLIIGLVAVALRLGVVLASPGGARGSFGYDASVYFAGSDALLHGRLPYQDFLFLHPPGVLLALLPVAALAQLVGDPAAFVIGNTLFTLLAGVSAALVVVVARQHRVPRQAALLGGLFYGVWFGAVQAEVSARLEPLGSVLLLTALALLGGGEEPVGRRRQVLAGLALGACVSTKIWWVLPVLLVLVHQVLRRRKQALPVLGGVLLAGALIDLPFLLAAPGQMWRMVVTDQLGRPDGGAGQRARLADLSTLHQAFPSLSGHALLAATGVASVAAGVLLLLAWRTRSSRLLVALAATQLVVLVVAPTYFIFYAGYVAAAMSLAVGAAAAAGRPGLLAARAAVGAAIVLTTIAVVRQPAFTVPVRGADAAAEQLRGVRCVVSDTPMALIALDALSRGLADGCPNWVDVSGRTYDVSKAPAGTKRGRVNNPVWQADLRGYLLSGDAVVLFRAETGADAQTKRMVDELPLLVRSGDFSVHRVP